ncbi:MAG: electron transport complex subunit E [Acetatifactor sp.]|nr:electron transport complex subunit E [Acetatifactor sp.]
MNKAGERLINGLVKENPTFVLMLGMCPTLAVTTSAMNGLGMGLATTAVLVMSNLFISLLRKVIPNRVRIPAFIVIIATFVTVVQLLLQAYLPALNKSLGVYIPLIVVNCIILGRAESFAFSNPPIPSFFDGLGMGLGFSFALTCIGAVRELLGAGKIFDMAIMPESFEPVRIFGQAPGAFFVLAALTALQNAIKLSRQKKGKSFEKIGSGCSEDCMNCDKKGCSKRFYDASALQKKEAAPVKKEETPVKKEEAPVKKEEAPAPVAAEAPAKKAPETIVKKVQKDEDEVSFDKLDDLDVVDLDEEE